MPDVSSTQTGYSNIIKDPVRNIGKTEGSNKGGDSVVITNKTALDEERENVLINEEEENARLQAEITAKLEQVVKLYTENQDTPLRASVLNRIIRLLTELIPILQHMGTAQAALLDYPTKMQAMYTDLISKAPIYTKDNPDERYKIDDDNKRNEKNSEVQAQTDKLRAYRDIWSDSSKKLQSNINTTNESVNQQIDLLTTFFQMLRELVSLISR